MILRTKTLTATLAGAVVLASGAYAIGSQQDDGSAQGARQSAVEDTARLEGLAGRLGVSESKLRSAMKDVHDEARRGRPDRAADLASALGVSESKVRAALGALRKQEGPRRDALRDQFTATLARELGVSEAKVRKAFQAPRAPGPRGRMRRRGGDPLARAAKQLGVTEPELRAALIKARPALPRGPREGPGRERLAAGLAKELALSSGQVRKALEKLRADRRSRRADLVDRLVKKLGISTEKVRSALGAGPPRGLRRPEPLGGPEGSGPPEGPGGPPGVGPGGPPPGLAY